MLLTEKVLPYVYRADHKDNGSYYYGYREQNVKFRLLPEKDIGVKYFTSSDTIKNKREEFLFTVIAVTQTGNDAYDIEQELIAEHFNDPLCLNKQYYRGTNKRWKKEKGIPMSDSQRKFLSSFHKNKVNAIDVETGISSRIPVEDFHNNSKYVHACENRTHAKHKITGEMLHVSLEEFYADENLVGLSSGIKIANTENVRVANQKIAKNLMAEGRHCCQIERTCPHCNLVGIGQNMLRYHFDNCKLKDNIRVKNIFTKKNGYIPIEVFNLSDEWVVYSFKRKSTKRPYQINLNSKVSKEEFNSNKYLVSARSNTTLADIEGQV